jgi:hypothetical protein
VLAHRDHAGVDLEAVVVLEVETESRRCLQGGSSLAAGSRRIKAERHGRQSRSTSGSMPMSSGTVLPAARRWAIRLTMASW